MVVLDCSVTMACLFEDEASEASERLLEALADGAVAHVPQLWPLEVSNVLLVAERRGRISAAESAAFWEALRGLRIEVDEQTATRAPETILHLARHYGLSTYDAAYLELAMRRGLPLATHDRKLATAATAAGVLPW